MAVETQDVDELVARARQYAVDLNTTLDLLAAQGVDCISASPFRPDYGMSGNCRVELGLLFKAAKAAA